jgi:hypothetical protein
MTAVPSARAAAGADGGDKRARLRVRRNVELAAQQRAELARAIEGGLASTLARNDHEGGALAVFPRRIECDQPLGRRNGGFAVAGRFRGDA